MEPPSLQRIAVVVFDVGYTLIDEARHWASWAQELAVSEAEFMAALRSVIADRRHHREVFSRLRPDFDLNSALRRRDASPSEIWTEEDLYPDVRAALSVLRAKGLHIGLAGNQPARALAALKQLKLPVDWIANSTELGVEKPAPDFFRRVAAKADCPVDAIAYVGDRLDNDVLPAQSAGMRGIFLRRGPWGEAHAHWPEAALAHDKIQSLLELTSLWPDRQNVTV